MHGINKEEKKCKTRCTLKKSVVLCVRKHTKKCSFDRCYQVKKKAMSFYPDAMDDADGDDMAGMTHTSALNANDAPNANKTVVTSMGQTYEWPDFITHVSTTDESGTVHDKVYADFDKLPGFFKDGSLSMGVPFNRAGYAQELDTPACVEGRQSLIIQPVFPFAMQTPTLALVLTAVINYEIVQNVEQQIKELRAHINLAEVREKIAELNRLKTVAHTKSRMSAGGTVWYCTSSSFIVMEFYRDILHCIGRTFWNDVKWAGKMEKAKKKADLAYKRETTMALTSLQKILAENPRLNSWINAVGSNKHLESWDEATLVAMMGSDALDAFKRGSETFQTKVIDMMENQLLRLMCMAPERKHMFKSPLLPVPSNRNSDVTIQSMVAGARERIVVFQSMCNHEKLQGILNRITADGIKSGSLPSLLDFAGYVQWQEHWSEVEEKKTRVQRTTPASAAGTGARVGGVDAFKINTRRADIPLPESDSSLASGANFSELKRKTPLKTGKVSTVEDVD